MKLAPKTEVDPGWQPDSGYGFVKLVGYFNYFIKTIIILIYFDKTRN